MFIDSLSSEDLKAFTFSFPLLQEVNTTAWKSIYLHVFMRHREVRPLAQGHTANQQEIWSQ